MSAGNGSRGARVFPGESISTLRSLQPAIPSRVNVTDVAAIIANEPNFTANCWALLGEELLVGIANTPSGVSAVAFEWLRSSVPPEAGRATPDLSLSAWHRVHWQPRHAPERQWDYPAPTPEPRQGWPD